MARLSFRCDEDLVKRVDAARGMIPREPFLRAAIEAIVTAVPEPSIQRHREPTEADREMFRAPLRDLLPHRPRASARVKADVQPRPKGGK